MLITDLAGSTELFDQTSDFLACSPVRDSLSHLLGLIFDIESDGQLDFFGQILNIASRVQADEIVGTKVLYSSPDLTEKVEIIQVSVMEDQVP